MKIVVPVKQGAILDEDFELRADGKAAAAQHVEYVLNECDEYAWEAALQIAEACGEGFEAVPISVGPKRAEDALRRCLARGGNRAVRVWDEVLEEELSPGEVARILARVVSKEGADLVLTGGLASDHAFAQTGISLAAELGWPHVAVVTALEYSLGDAGARVRRELEGGLLEVLEVRCPAVLTIQAGINAPRYASLRGVRQAQEKPIEVLALADLGLSGGGVTAARSFRVRRMYRPARGCAELIEGSAADQALRLAEIIKALMGAAG